MIQTHPKMLDEIFSYVNEALSPDIALVEVLKQPYVREYLQLCVDNTWTVFDVDSVSDVQEYNYHRSMAGAFLLNRHTWNTIDQVIIAKGTGIKAKAKQFKALSEMLYSGEAKILRAILTKNIQSLYPNMTHELISGSL